jgi:hypothetical protein
MNLKRKIKRKKEKENKKIEQKIKNKLMMFDLLPKQCLICETDFDRKDREMVQSWSVVVSEQQEKVRLYCPDCWSRAKKMIEEIVEKTNAESS